MALYLILHLLLYHQQVPLELQEPLALLGHLNHHHLLPLHPIIKVTMIDTRLKLYVSPIPDELHMDDDTTVDEQSYLSSGEDVGRDHIPTVNLRQSWWKPITEDRPATPEQLGLYSEVYLYTSTRELTTCSYR
ncbi:hypothetical protein Tco_0948681 [Tanacetum coccineum]